jgi:colanic acid biosynthesis glycosyl transferase WcaI
MGFQQDLATVVDAATQLRAERDIVFVLVGDGVARGDIEQTLKDRNLTNVVLGPMLERDDYAIALQACDVGVVTLLKSIHTPGVPSKLFNIMAAARPTIISANEDGDAPAILLQANAGLWVPPGEPGRFAQAVLTLRDNPDIAAEMGRNARRAVEAKYSRISSAARYELLFAQLTSPPYGPQAQGPERTLV